MKAEKRLKILSRTQSVSMILGIVLLIVSLFMTLSNPVIAIWIEVTGGVLVVLSVALMW